MWSVDSMTDWGIKPTCFAISDQWGQCYLKLPVLVYSEFCLAGEGAETLPRGSPADPLPQNLQRRSPSAS